ncbi:hypothetical protein [Planctomicrobium piriforme]|uniref:hypothetical protein n=1 Tax=Planctomicrobium piriforme TaxID=1576369 RepID=UPI00111359AA|nr:hypothetical protein [Planctomicrobium piriforme]
MSRFASRAFLAFVFFSVLYGLLLLTARLTGTFADWFSPWSLAILPGLSMLTAVLWPGRVTTLETASAIDRSRQTQDLFLTLASLKDSDLEYAPLVARDAEQLAGSISPREVAPFQWERRSLVAGVAASILALGTVLVPTLDPFGKVAAAKQQTEAQKLLEETKQQTQARQAQLAQKDVEKENSEEIERALEQLKSTFQKMQPQQPQQNLERLNAEQKQIGEMYRKLSSGDLKPLFERIAGDQQLGQQHDQDQFRKWQEELQQGKSDSLQKQLEKIQSDMQKLAQSSDPVERSELERELQKELKELSDFAQTRTGSKSLSAALQRAQQQMQAAKQQGMTKEALEALEESIELTQKEMQNLAQSSRDLKDLEDALRLVSMAKQCKGNCNKPGEEGADGEQTLADYAKLYAELARQYQQGEGTGNEGQGKGGEVEEDDSVATNFVDEKSKSAIQKGKILMSMSAKGVSESGEMQDQNYKKIVGEIRQSLDEVINAEEIPPGYVDGIKKYFDTMEKK